MVIEYLYHSTAGLVTDYRGGSRSLWMPLVQHSTANDSLKLRVA